MPRLPGRSWCRLSWRRRMLAALLTVLLGGVCVSARSAQAQTPISIPGPVPVAPAGPSGSPSASLAGSPSARAGLDTTLRPGRQDFAPYSTPGWCVAAVRATEAMARRADPDSATVVPERDTLMPAARAVAQRCGTQFTPATVATADLLDLARLALLRGDDATAQTAVARAVTAQPDPGRRRWVLFTADTIYMNAQPRRLPAALAVTARLDSLGPAAALQRKLAHEQLWMDARQHYDLQRLFAEGLALFAVCRQLSPRDTLDFDGSCEGEEDLALRLYQAALYEDPARAMALTRARMQPVGFTNWVGLSAMLQLVRVDWMVAQMGKPLPPLVADQWAGPPGRAPGWPVRGKVSLYLRGNLNLDNVKSMAQWKRLADEFKDGLDITVLVVARGFFGADNQMPGAAALLLTPAQEAERVRRFYSEQLGVPVTVALMEAPVRLRLPQPDGRVIRGEPRVERDPYYKSSFLLADKAGKFLLGGGGFFEEPALRAWIARAVGGGREASRGR